jgi:hypothetical protein
LTEAWNFSSAVAMSADELLDCAAVPRVDPAVPTEVRIVWTWVW